MNNILFIKKDLNEIIKELRDLVSSSITLKIYKREEKEIMDYYNKYKEVIIEDVREVLNDKSTVLNDQIEFYNANISSELYIEFVQIHIARRIKLFSKFRQKDYKHFIDTNNDNLDENRINKKYWYRGHASTSWNLIPSFYRHLGKKHELINYKFLSNEYKRTNVMNKVNDVIESKDLNYEQLAYIQHSISFSPLLDFSTNYQTSRSFAVGDLSSPFIMQDEDAALFELNVNDKNIIDNYDEADKAIKELNVEYYGNNPRISTIIKSKLWNEFLSNEEVFSTYHLIDIKTNDRMRIQGGTFVLFNNVIIVGNDILFSSKAKLELYYLITKYIIYGKSGERYDIYKDIMKKNSKYHIENMLHPYDFMKKI